MKNKLIILIFSVLSLTSFATAQDTTDVKDKTQQKDQTQHGTKFVDEDGDGFNDNAPDHDGDGIPNGLDPDYEGPGKEKKKKFVDLNGDGIDDNVYNAEGDKKYGKVGPKNKSTSAQTGETKQSMKRKRSGKK